MLWVTKIFNSYYCLHMYKVITWSKCIYCHKIVCLHVHGWLSPVQEFYNTMFYIIYRIHNYYSIELFLRPFCTAEIKLKSNSSQFWVTSSEAAFSIVTYSKNALEGNQWSSDMYTVRLLPWRDRAHEGDLRWLRVAGDLTHFWCHVTRPMSSTQDRRLIRWQMDLMRGLHTDPKV